VRQGGSKRYSSVSTVTRIQTGRPESCGSIPNSDKIDPSSSPHAERLWGVTRGKAVCVCVCEADHSRPFGAEVKNAWIYTATSFMVPLRAHGHL
jgi:hypothetical protein